MFRRLLKRRDLLLAAALGSWSPAGAAVVGRADRDIPFELINGSILVRGSAAGRQVTVLVDSGAAKTVLAPSVANGLGWTTGSALTVRGVSATAEVARGPVLTLVLGQATIVVQSTAVFDLTQISSPMGIGIDVVIGRDLLDNNVVAFDFARRTMRLGPPSGGTLLPGVALELGSGEHGERFMLASIEGRAPVRALFDLGSSNPLMLSANYAEQSGILRGKRTSTAAIGGVEGIKISTAFVADTLQVGSTRLHRVPAEALPDWLEPRIIANLGLPVLSRFLVTCDFANNQVHLTPTAATDRPFPRDHSGLGVAVHPERLTVIHVAADSPAGEAGLKVGDEIVSIDEQVIGPDYPRRPLSDWRTWSPGRLVGLTLTTGRIINVRLREYY